MEPADHAFFVLKILLALGPLSLYFLGLGLLNSQARPYLVSTRTDFTLLVTVFIPVIVLPVLLLLEHGLSHLVTVVAVGLVILFVALLPKRDQGWVLYNCSPAQGRRLMQQAVRRFGWEAVWRADGSLEVRPVDLHITQTSLPWLRSVTLHAEGPATPASRAARRRLMDGLRGEIQQEAMLPSATGASLVLIGATLLGLPMWYLFQNINAIVETVRRILSAPRTNPPLPPFVSPRCVLRLAGGSAPHIMGRR